MLTFGPKVTQTEFDTNIFQGHDPICAIRCQEMILRDYGIQIPNDSPFMIKGRTFKGQF